MVTSKSGQGDNCRWSTGVGRFGTAPRQNWFWSRSLCEEAKEEQAAEEIGGLGLRIVQGCMLCEVKGVSRVIVAPRGSKERGE